VHLAVAQGELAARHAFRVKGAKPVDYSLLLNVVFTDPQLATIGALESELKKRRQPFLSASYPFSDHGKSILMDANYGYVKVVAEPRRGRILGAENRGPHCRRVDPLFQRAACDAGDRLRSAPRPLVPSDARRNHHLPAGRDRRPDRLSAGRTPISGFFVCWIWIIGPRARTSRANASSLL